MPRCGTSSPGPKVTAESKVRRSSVIPSCTWHSCSARQVSTLSFSAPWSPTPLILHPWSPNSLILPHWSPNCLILHPWSPNSLIPYPYSLYSPSLVSKLSFSPTAPRRAVTTRIRRVSGKWPAICFCCCLDLWEFKSSFLLSGVWSHYPCVIDVSSTIDTDSEALPPARCDISTFCQCFHFACTHRSHYRPVTIDRLQIEALPSL